ncbi:hypothetical protein CFOL_v3_16661 [Cephalotus follicularis]|uniref:Uncharacterized protein n=1 Tax=Cephalotus follicularis TaxID=3775 RepID=A0A1Q3BYS7_CEPFO|nr:hypothetical protein CFOL_v3_16661 [Cephalotus follicularis]
MLRTIHIRLDHVEQNQQDSIENVTTQQESCHANNRSRNIDHHHHSISHRTMKLEVSCFNGTTVEGWIFTVEQFFDFYNTSEDQILRISYFHMDGPAREHY